MPTVVTSKHLQGTTELTLIADIKPGLVPIPEPMSYAYRLRRVLEFLFQARQNAVERSGQVGSAGPLERLRMLHFVHWAIHDHDRKLLLAVSFDGPWEPYIHSVVEEAGPLLDVIFSHCEGYAGRSCFDGYEPFSAWVRERQINCDFFYAGAPDVTVDDVRYLQEFERNHANGKRRAPFEAVSSRLRVGEPPPPLLDAAARKRLLSGLFALRTMFPPGPPGTEGAANDAFVFGRVAALLTRDIRAVLTNGAGSPPSWFPPPPQEPSSAEVELLQWARDELPRYDVLQKPQVPAQTPHHPHEIQGNVLRGYEGVTHGCALLGRFESAAGAIAFIQRWKNALTTEVGSESLPGSRLSPGTRLNLALTLNGLASLGVSSEELALFPKEFQEGFAARAGMLGDIGRNHPSRWQLPEHNWPKPQGDRIPLAAIDFVLVLQQSAPGEPLDYRLSDRHPLFEDVKTIAESTGAEILHVRPLLHYDRGHFGIADGKSQPHPRGTTASVAARDQVALGELLLGYENERGEKRLGNLPPELIQNSTFLVMRQMSLDVPGFREVVSEASNSGIDEQTYLAKVVGRRADGSPLLESGDTDNDFDYQNDPQGAKCPLFSHVRRANPRTTRRIDGRDVSPPRIVRRGLSYGPLAGEEDLPGSPERGLLFMAYCASIADQYEVIQRWVNGGNSSGVLSAHADPLAGNFPERNGFERLLGCVHEGRAISIPLPARPLSELKWGLYFFVPSIGALEFLLSRVGKTQLETEPRRRAVLEFLKEMHELESLHPHRAALAWKLVLEDRDQRVRAAAVWEYVRQNGGALRTAYGVLVGSADGVLTVLGEHKRFSVRRYWHRMQKSFGVHYLGMDPEPQPLERACPVSAPRDGGDFAVEGDEYPLGTAPYVPEGAYHRISALPNEFALSIGSTEAYRSAYSSTRRWLEGRKDGSIDLRQLAREVIFDVARELIGTPEPPAMDASPERASSEAPARCPVDLQRVSQFIFHPRPSVALARTAEVRGKVVLQTMTAFVSDPAPPARFSKFFRERIAKADSELTQYTGAGGEDFELNGQRGEASALTGLVNGFCVPTSGTFVSVMSQWLDSERIHRLKRWLLQSSDTDLEQRERLLGGEPESSDINHGPLFEAMIEAMMRAPIPDLLHRVATGSRHASHAADDEIDGVLLSRGDRVVVSLSSAAIDARRRGRHDFASVLFGGDRDALDYPVHACPGQKMAFGVLTGMFVAILSLPELAIVPPLSLAFATGRPARRS